MDVDQFRPETVTGTGNTGKPLVESVQEIATYVQKETKKQRWYGTGARSASRTSTCIEHGRVHQFPSLGVRK